jgi:hypothetical protein
MRDRKRGKEKKGRRKEREGQTEKPRKWLSEEIEGSQKSSPIQHEEIEKKKKEKQLHRFSMN